MIGVLISYPRGAEIFGQTQPATHLYQVVTGSVRTFKILADGRRQVCGFYFPGDYFGLEPSDQHASYAFAINDVECIVTKRRTVIERADRRRDVARQLLAISEKEVRILRDQTLMLTKNADGRLAWFLLEIARRTGSPQTISLPMPRRDIADYLDITIETISRTVTKFESAGWIKANSPRRIQLNDLTALTLLVS